MEEQGESEQVLPFAAAGLAILLTVVIARHYRAAADPSTPGVAEAETRPERQSQ